MGPQGYSPLRVEQRLAMQQTEYLNRQQQRLNESEIRLQQETPFQPNRDRKKNDGPLTARHREQESLFENKWEFLHADSVRKTKQNKNDLSKDDVDFIRERDQYTFHPNRQGNTSGRNMESVKTDTSSPTRFPKKISPTRKVPGGKAAKNEPFEMNVNIGGQRMTLHADLHSDPTVAAKNFMRANNLEDKFLSTLVNVISDQQRQIREQQA